MRLLKIGMSGTSVTYLQERLNKHGHHVAVDGDFGTKTRDAVIHFQAAHVLTPDGVVGAKTWAMLRVEDRSPAPDDLNRESVEWLKGLAKKGLSGQPWSKQRYRCILYALEYLGAEEYPLGTNKGPEIDDAVQGYMEHWKWSDRSKYPAWCAIWASVMMARGVLSVRTPGRDIPWKQVPFGDWYGKVSVIEDTAQDLSIYLPASGPAPTGAFFTMGRGGSSSDPSEALTTGHLGIVILDDGDHFYSLDGNVFDSVQMVRRSKSEIRGYVPWYEIL